MGRGSVGLVIIGVALASFFIGTRTGPGAITFPDPDKARTADEMEQVVEAALSEPRAFPRSSTLIRLFEGLTKENVAGAARAVSSRAGRWDPVDLQLFLTAWVHLDGLSAIREVEGWPIRSRREIGMTVVMREWAASGHALEAVSYYEGLRDPHIRKVAAGPLVRGWVLSGDVDGALVLARQIWIKDDHRSVVDGFVRGALHLGGPEGAIEIARRVDPSGGDEFAQRLAVVTLNLVGREDVMAAIEYYEELAADPSAPWLEGSLDLLAGLRRNQDPEGTLDWLLTLPESAERTQSLTETIGTWAIRDMAAAEAWLVSRRGPMPGSGELDATDSALVAGIVRRLARTRPAEAAARALRLRAESDRMGMLDRVAHFWSRQDPAAAQAWIDRVGVTAEQRERLRAVAARARGASEVEATEREEAS